MRANARPARSKAELVELYPFRSAVPASLWWDLFSRADQQIGVLVYAANFLHEQYPALNDLLREKAAAGCKIRVALGDPDSEAVRARGAEERFGHGIETRCRVALMHYLPLIGVPGIEIHLHRTTFYNSIYRADDDLLVNAHVWGVNAYSVPVTPCGGSLRVACSTPTPPASRRCGQHRSPPPHSPRGCPIRRRTLVAAWVQAWVL